MTGLDLYWTSILELFPPPGIEAISLFESSRNAWLQTRDFVVAPDLISLFELERDVSSGTKILGASLEGIFPRFFEDILFENTTNQANNSRIIVIGSNSFAGFLMNTTMARERNLDFLIRSAVWLGGAEELLEITRHQGIKRLDRIQNPEVKHRVMNFSRILNVYIIPVFILLTGMIVLNKRKKNDR
jgi:ABC-type uncharacterized transport system involved in gliding motility auxiliary subunit